MRRSGFTLLELLVAAGIFMFGFVAAYSMFLAGVRNRQLADSITRTSLASTSIITEIRMRAGREAQINSSTAVPCAPSFYVGNGFADDGPESDGFARYPDQPGIWYRVSECTDLTNGDDPTTVAIKLRLIIIHVPISSEILEAEYQRTGSGTVDYDVLPLAVVQRRFRIDDSLTMDETAASMVERQTAQVYDTVIHRHPSWMP